jgi:hypothetical protein
MRARTETSNHLGPSSRVEAGRQEPILKSG